MKTEPRWYGVSSPEFATYGGDLMDPPEYGRDWLPVFTHGVRRARLLAVRAWKRRGSRWWEAHEKDENPFARVIVERMHPCEHGKIFDCGECEKGSWDEVELSSPLAEWSL